MSIIHSPFPKLPIPGIPGRKDIPIILLTKLIDLAKKIFKTPKQETPQDVIDRNHQMREFCDYVNEQARQTEIAVAEQMQVYAEQLIKLSQETFQEYAFRTEPLVRQIHFLSSQIQGTIAAEVSCHLTDSDAEFTKIRFMLPGAEKEAAMQRFAKHAIQMGCEKCAKLVEQALEQIQEELFLLLQDKLGEAQCQLNASQEQFAELQNAGSDTQKQEEVRARAQLKSDCCEFVMTLWEG